MDPQIKSSKETELSKETTSHELTPEEAEVMKYVLVLQRKWSQMEEE